MQIARIGVLLDEEEAQRRWTYGVNIFDKYVGEVMDHEGITYEWLSHPNRIAKQTFDIVIVVLAKDDELTTQSLKQFMEAGGTVITYGGLNFLGRELGYRVSGKHDSGYAVLPEGWGDTRPLRHAGALPWEAQKAEAATCQSNGKLLIGTPEGEAGGTLIQQFSIGSGRLERWSVQIPSTIVKLQQGSGPIFEDGYPPSDGSAVIDEGILKADDDCIQDWEYDRVKSETGAQYFAHPYADLWREALVRHLVSSALSLNMTLPLTGHWPEGVKHMAMISHDSDWSEDAAAETTMELLKEQGINSTWCMIQTGYSGHIHDRIAAEGHELAMHYNALNGQGGSWSKEEFDRQYKWLSEQLPVDKLYSNKNHYTRFEGWGEFFEWCEENGIAVDQSRGPSKPGNVGFLFGTCQPYVPIAWANDQNRFYDVLEIGFLTQDIPAWTDRSVVHPFLEQVKRVDGVAHFLFHQGRIHAAKEVYDSLKWVIQTLKEQEFTFWTSRQIGEWEQLRRTIKVNGVHEDGVSFRCDQPLESALIYIPIHDGKNELSVDVDKFPVVERFGISCLEISITNL